MITPIFFVSSTRSLVYYKRIWLQDSQMERCTRQGVGKGCRAPISSPVPWISPHVHQLSSSPLDFSDKYLKYWKSIFVLLMETQISFISPLVYSIPKEKCRSLNSMMKMLHFSKSLIQGQNNIVSWGPSRDLSEDPMK